MIYLAVNLVFPITFVLLGTPLTMEKKREPLTKEKVQQIAKQLTENSMEVLIVTSYDSCMYDGGGVLYFKVIFNCCCFSISQLDMDR